MPRLHGRRGGDRIRDQCHRAHDGISAPALALVAIAWNLDGADMPEANGADGRLQALDPMYRAITDDGRWIPDETADHLFNLDGYAKPGCGEATAVSAR